MGRGFSESSKLLIQQRNVLAAAENRFLEEWGQMLQSLHRHFSGKGWICRFLYDELLQLTRSRWPNESNQVHYEVLCNSEFLRRGIVDLSLHVEDGVPNQEAVCARLRELLRPHAAKLHELLARFTPSMPDLPMMDILKGQIPLEKANTDVMGEALQKMMQIETFVDEALFLAGTRTVWRTDFGSSSPRMNPGWFGKDSNQRTVPGAGRCESSAWRMDGTNPNARLERSEQGVFCVLVAEDVKNLVSNCGRYRICAVVKTSQEARLGIRGEGHVYAPDGHDMAWPKAFCASQEVSEEDSLNMWRCVEWEVEVPPVEEITGWFREEDGGGKRSIPFDFAKDGIWVVLNVQTEDREFLIDSIEIAQCEDNDNG